MIHFIEIDFTIMFYREEKFFHVWPKKSESGIFRRLLGERWEGCVFCDEIWRLKGDMDFQKCRYII
jgi:hypothetical protein